MDYLSHDARRYIGYAYYWQPSVSHGANLIHSRPSKKTDFEVQKIRKIAVIAASVVTMATLAIAIYNVVIYQKLSNRLTSTLTVDTSTSTTNGANTIEDIPTSAAVTTDVVTTNTPEKCWPGLPYGADNGDSINNGSIKDIEAGVWKLANRTFDVFIRLHMIEGYVVMKDGRFIVSIKIYGADFDLYNWTLYYRTVSSKSNMEAIACLIQNPKIDRAFVFTWHHNTDQAYQMQLILAVVERSTSYMIRIYSEKLPPADLFPFKIYYHDFPSYESKFTNMTNDDARGKRQVVDITTLGENSPILEQGQNCPFFTC